MEPDATRHTTYCYSQWRSYVDVPGSADPDGFGVALVAGNFLPVKTPVKKIRDPGRLAAHSL